VKAIASEAFAFRATPARRPAAEKLRRAAIAVCRVSERAPCAIYERAPRMSFQCATSNDVGFGIEVVAFRLVLAAERHRG
jgi:hypothetical protein